MKIFIKPLFFPSLLFLILIGCSGDDDSSSGGNNPPTVNTTLKSRQVIATLSVPWEMQWGPDDHLWLTERGGRVSRVNPENGDQTIIADLSNQVEQVGESGLLGMALHPNFNSIPRVYLVYTYRNINGFFERLSQFTFVSNSLTSEIVFLDNIPAGNIHNGSRIIITSDDHILMTTGDVGDTSLSQNPNSLAGKVLRISLDGSIPTDNPDPNSYVYTLGHRNPQGLLMHPNGMVYSSEHGPDTDDEINIIQADNNYGWPNVLGIIDNADEEAFDENTEVTEAIMHWTPTIAPSDIFLYTSDRIPQFQNKIMLTSLREQTLFALTLSENGQEVVETERFFEGELGRLRDVVMAPDGRLFLATNGSSINDNSATHSIIEIDVAGQ